MAFKTTVIYQSNLTLPGSEDSLVGFVVCSSQAELLTVEGVPNAPPEGATPNISIPIRVSSTRKYGITARHIVIARIAGTSTDQYRVYRRIPIFDPTFFSSILSEFAGTVEFESLSDWVIVGGQSERYHLLLGAVG